MSFRMVDRTTEGEGLQPLKGVRDLTISMRAAVLRSQAPIASNPLSVEHVDRPEPGAGELLVRVEACGCCRTDLHVIEGDLPPAKLPVIPGHQVVGAVEAVGSGVTEFQIGDRAGIAWLRHVDGTCKYCLAGNENLCPNVRFTGYMADGGYAEYAVVDAHFAYHLPVDHPAAQVASLLCAGIIGYRALKRSGVRPGGPFRDLWLRELGSRDHPGRSSLGLHRLRGHAS